MRWPQHHQAGLSSPADNEEERAKDTMEGNEQAGNGGSGEFARQAQKPTGYKSNLGTSWGPDGLRHTPRTAALPDSIITMFLKQGTITKRPMTHAWRGIEGFVCPHPHPPKATRLWDWSRSCCCLLEGTEWKGHLATDVLLSLGIN